MALQRPLALLALLTAAACGTAGDKPADQHEEPPHAAGIVECDFDTGQGPCESAMPCGFRAQPDATLFAADMFILSREDLEAGIWKRLEFHARARALLLFDEEGNHQRLDGLPPGEYVAFFDATYAGGPASANPFVEGEIPDNCTVYRSAHKYSCCKPVPTWTNFDPLRMTWFTIAEDGASSYGQYPTDPPLVRIERPTQSDPPSPLDAGTKVPSVQLERGPQACPLVTEEEWAAMQADTDTDADSTPDTDAP